MTAKTTTRPGMPAAAAPGIVIERTFEAPRERVWKAWTDPALLKRWWAPSGFTTPHCSVDLRVGGKFHYCMRTPDGKDIWGIGVYREVAAPERLVYVDSFADAQGNPVAPTVYGASPDHPREMLVTVTFADHQGKTKVTLRHDVPAGVPEREGMRQGWTEMMDRLAGSLDALAGVVAPGDRNRATVTMPSDLEVRMERVFDAPAERVFKAYTDPNLIPQWWGPRRHTTRVEAMDVRPGGAWRYVSRDAEGTEFGFHGVYREVVPPRKLVSTFEFDGMPGHVSVDTATFEDLGGRTRLVALSRFASKEDRDGMLASGMEEGALETWDRLAELLRKQG